jgi:hypothetical protein
MASPSRAVENESYQSYRNSAINWGWAAVAGGTITLGLSIFLGVDFNNLHSTAVGLTSGAISVGFIGTAVMGGIAEVNRRKMREWQSALSNAPNGVLNQPSEPSPAEHEPVIPPAPDKASTDLPTPKNPPRSASPPPVKGPDLGIPLHVYSFAGAFKSIINLLKAQPVDQAAIREIIQKMTPEDASSFILDLQSMMDEMRDYVRTDEPDRKHSILEGIASSEAQKKYGLDSHIWFIRANDLLVQDKNNQWVVQEICNRFSKATDAGIILNPYRTTEA